MLSEISCSVLRNDERPINRRPRTVILACAVALAIVTAAPSTQAHTTVQSALSTPHNYTLEAQPLGQALNAVARQAGVAISVNADWVSGKSAPALNGTMNLRQALDR